MTAATTITSAERERQRVEHLVLERPRPPAPAPKKPRGMSRMDWAAAKGAAAARAAEAAQLAPDVEVQVQLRERWSGAGTPQTHYHADRAKRRAGCLARLFATGTVNAQQLQAATEIAETFEAIAAAVAIRSSFGFDRVDCGFRPENAGELGGHVPRELIYNRWRGAAEGPIGAVLAMIVDDAGLVEVARAWRMSDRRAREVLVDALDLWNGLLGRQRSR